MKVNVNKIENRITFNLKLDYSLKHLTLDAMKLLGNNKIAQNTLMKTYLN